MVQSNAIKVSVFPRLSFLLFLALSSLKAFVAGNFNVENRKWIYFAFLKKNYEFCSLRKEIFEKCKIYLRGLKFEIKFAVFVHLARCS